MLRQNWSELFPTHVRESGNQILWWQPGSTEAHASCFLFCTVRHLPPHGPQHLLGLWTTNSYLGRRKQRKTTVVDQSYEKRARDTTCHWIALVLELYIAAREAGNIIFVSKEKCSHLNQKETREIHLGQENSCPCHAYENITALFFHIFH